MSKTELTYVFLLEVFGAVYYKEVLIAIYNLQPRRDDDSPVYDGYYNIQLYNIFMQLSLLNFPESHDKHKENTLSVEKISSIEYGFKMENLIDFLIDERRRDSDKKIIINRLLRQKPEAFIYWLRNDSSDNSNLIVILVRIID